MNLVTNMYGEGLGGGIRGGDAPSTVVQSRRETDRPQRSQPGKSDSTGALCS